jgi:molybdopterin molybdotransferase
MPGGLTEIEEARRIVLAEVEGPPDLEGVALADALGRTLAADATSAEDVPGFDNSAMDGYAVRAAEVATASAESAVELPLVGESRAGAPAARELGAGEAIRISTGAMVPAGADAVVRQEDTEDAGEAVRIAVAPSPGANIRRAGEDIRSGDTVIRAGTTLGPAELGVLASIDLPRVSCARRPRVVVLCTGDELRGPGEPLPPGGVRNSNAFTVPALARLAGAAVVAVERVPDDPEVTRRTLERALGADAVVICGGVSVGPHDHVRPALAELGVTERFWGVALRPGKPTWFGCRGATLVYGLPGNPVSAVVTFLLFVRPALLAHTGSTPDRERATAILADPYPKSPGRAHLVRATLRLVPEGWEATPTGEQGSHILTSMLGADCLAIMPSERGDLAAGERVEVELLPRLASAT